MNKIFVEDVVCKVNSSWAASSGAVGVGILFREEGETPKWITNVEIEGAPSIYLSDERILEKVFFDDELDYDEQDIEEADKLADKYLIDSFSDIKLGRYSAIVQSIDDSKDASAAKLITYLVVVSRCSMEDTNKYIELAKGRYIEDLNLLDVMKKTFE